MLFLPNGLHLPYFPVWLSARGLSDAEIAAALATPLALRVVATPLIAAFADWRGIGIALSCAATALLLGYCGLRFAEGFAPIFAGAVVVALAMGAMPALADALTLTEIRRAEIVGRRIAYGHIRVWTSIGVLSMMLASGRIVAAFPGARIIIALAALSLFSVGVAIFAAVRMNMRRAHASTAAGGGLTADAARLRLAIVGIGAAALIQASHAEVYSFATIHWRAAGLSPDRISAAWAIGVASESVLFVVAARYFRTERNAIAFLLLGAAGAAVRWIAMSFDPGPNLVVALQTLHGLSWRHHLRQRAPAREPRLADASRAHAGLAGGGGRAQPRRRDLRLRPSHGSFRRERLSRHGGAGRRRRPRRHSRRLVEAAASIVIQISIPRRRNGSTPRCAARDKGRTPRPPRLCGDRARSACTSPASRTA